jgi:hypothetical protein
LLYHGGLVDRIGSKTFAIYWQPAGSYMSAGYESLTQRYFRDVGGSPFYGIASQYSDGGGNIANISTVGGAWQDTSPYPSSTLGDADVENELLKAINANGWPVFGTDSEFFLFTASGESVCTGGECFLTSFCAYHNDFAVTDGVQTGNLRYAMMPYSGANPSACGGEAAQATPNNDPDADGEINLISHEHLEMVTDPDGTAWYDSSGSGSGEIGDKCAWTFAPLNAQRADAMLDGNPYTVQQEWSNSLGGCVISSQQGYTLSVTKVGTGTGTVTSSPSGINCGSVCVTQFPSATSPTLSATPSAGSVFAGWGGACSGNAGTCPVAMNTPKSVTATFNAGPVCTPRPPVNVQTTAADPGRLLVRISVSGANNWLNTLQFGAASNALIDAGSFMAATGNFTLNAPPQTTATTFYVRHQGTGATTVPLTVTDGCGTWTTFVGGGPSAF